MGMAGGPLGMARGRLKSPNNVKSIIKANSIHVYPAQCQVHVLLEVLEDALRQEARNAPSPLSGPSLLKALLLSTNTAFLALDLLLQVRLCRSPVYPFISFYDRNSFLLRILTPQKVEFMRDVLC